MDVRNTTGAPTITLDGANGIVTAVSFSSSSDRNVKTNFSAVEPRAVLAKVAALPILRWYYQQDAATPHIGPMAQDFKAAFYPGSDDKSITTLEADGVAFAAIQGLNQKVEQKETEITELKVRLEKLERLLNQK